MVVRDTLSRKNDVCVEGSDCICQTIKARSAIIDRANMYLSASRATTLLYLFSHSLTLFLFFLYSPRLLF
jgi:hypothetical protein